jgi:glycosyltransferase involved in cell wall biosynthesis
MTRPRVLVSAVRLTDGDPARRSGNYYLAINLIRALARHEDIDLSVLADEDSIDDLGDLLPGERLEQVAIRGNVVRRDLAIASAVYKLRPALFHKPTGALPTIPLPCATLSGIADLNFATLPMRLDKRLYKEVTHRWTAAFADHIVCISEFTRQEVITYLKPDPSRVSVIHLGSNPLTGDDDGLGARLRTNGSFWVAFAHHAHKNLETLLRALAVNRQRAGARIRLAVIGEGPYVSSALQSLAHTLNVSDDVTFLGKVPAGSLRGLYQHSEGLLFPSHYEGFGLPILEAMSLGSPVVCSNVCAMPEVAGDAAVLVAPTDVDAILAGVAVLRSPARDGFVERGLTRSRQFTWERAAGETVSLYRRMLATAQPAQTAA